MLEQLYFGDKERAARIKAIIDRHERSLQNQSDSWDNGDSGDDSSDWENFDIRNVLGKTVKK